MAIIKTLNEIYANDTANNPKNSIAQALKFPFNTYDFVSSGTDSPQFLKVLKFEYYKDGKLIALPHNYFEEIIKASKIWIYTDGDENPEVYQNGELVTDDQTQKPKNGYALNVYNFTKVMFSGVNIGSADSVMPMNTSNSIIIEYGRTGRPRMFSAMLMLPIENYDYNDWDYLFESTYYKHIRAATHWQDSITIIGVGFRLYDVRLFAMNKAVGVNNLASASIQGILRSYAKIGVNRDGSLSSIQFLYQLKSK